MFNFEKNKYNDFDYKTKKYLIAKYLKDKKVENLKQELFVAKRLLLAYPNGKFWLNYDLTFKLNSLAFFFTPDGAALINSAYKEFFLEFSACKSYILSEPVKMDTVVPKSKPISIREFLKT